MKRLLPAIAIASTLTLAGCVADDGSLSARTTLATLEALTGEERVEAVLAIAAENEAALRREWGVDEALGGTPSADVTMGSLIAPLVDLTSGDEVISFAPASLSEGSGGGVGTMLGLGFVMIGQLGDNAMTLADQGNSGTQSDSSPGYSAEISISDGSVSSTFKIAESRGGASTQVSSETELSYCPAPDGTLELKGKAEVRLTIKNVTASISLDLVATGRLDDSATLVASDYTYRHQISSTTDGKGEFFDHSSGARDDITVNRESSGTTLEFAQSAVDSAAALANMVANDMMDAAKRGWESGRCVTLTVTPSEDPGSLEPSAEITLDAAPTATLDGQPAAGTVTATLSGEGELDPTGAKVDAPATFTYTAADEKDLSGTATFESRSKRGVGKATLTLSTGGQAYSARGTEGEFTATGTICSLTSQFVLTGSGLTLTFTPNGEWDGTFQLTGFEDGVSFIGDGSYDVTYDGAIATNVIVDGDMTLSTPEGVTATSPTDLNVVLTPIEPCE